MPDHPPFQDYERITPSQGALLYGLRKHLSDVEAITHSPVIDLSVSEQQKWAQFYIKAKLALERQEIEVAQTIWVIPWTIHTAGAPGNDEQFACNHPECSNPWCGHVQKCSRCHDVLSFGFSGPGLIADTLTQMFSGVSTQDFMHSRFGDNPVDDEGPTWFPVGTEIAKREVPAGQQMYVCGEPDVPTLEANEILLPCDVLHAKIAEQMGAEL